MTEDTAPRPRLWPLYAIGGAIVLALAITWFPESQMRQIQVMATMGTFILAIFFTLLWLLFLSRLPRSQRLQYFGAAVLVIGLCVGSFRIKGMSGDFVPIFIWRWSDGGELQTAAEGGAITPIIARYWNQFLGPERNNQLREVHLQSDWQAHPPREVWRREVGPAWSSFAIVDGRAITQEQHGPEEQVICYDLATGRKLWSHADSARYETTVAGIGPRATPTIDGDQVFTMGATGILNCLDLTSGARIWSRDILTDNGATAHMWGISCSPLVLNSLIVVSAGGPDGRSLVAYHRDSGEPIWGGGDDKAGFSSPRLVTLAGREQILIFNNHSVAAHDPQSGAILWRQPWDQVECIADPLPLPGDQVLASSGYGIGAKLYQVKPAPDGGLETDIVWETPRLKAKFANMVYRDGFVYGLDDGVLVCLDPQNGQRRWKRGRYGHGQLLLIDDILLVMTESGEIVLVKAQPDGHEELARMTTFEGKTWNSPAFAAPYLLLRTDGEAVCYELPLADGSLAQR
jgi:outer membrane protein assembly factor BamB